VVPLKVAQFLVYLTDSRSLMHHEEVVSLGERSPHALIAQAVVQEALNGDGTDGKVYGRVLTLLHADPIDQATVRAIRQALISIEGAVTDKPTVKAIQKRAEELKAIDHQPDAELAPMSPGESAGASSNASPTKAARRKLNKNKVVNCLDSDEDSRVEEVEAKLTKTQIKQEEDEAEEEPLEEEEAVFEEPAAPVVEKVKKETKKASKMPTAAKQKAPIEKAPAGEEEATPAVTKSQLNKLKVAELRAELGKRSLDSKGTKPLLVERLWNVMQGLTEQAEEEEESSEGGSC